MMSDMSFLKSTFLAAIVVFCASGSFAEGSYSFGAAAGYLDDPIGGSQTELSLFGSGRYDLNPSIALNMSGRAGQLSGGGTTANFLTVEASPEISFGDSLRFKGVGAVNFRSDQDTYVTLGSELSYGKATGLGADVFFGETHGGALAAGSSITNKAITLHYRAPNGIDGQFYVRKDTLNTATGDRDFYDYGVGVDVPVGREGTSIVSLRVGETRFDALDKNERRVTLGFTYGLGNGGAKPPKADRSILQGLLQF
jgi:hypothetical protein